jgi:transposase-like protein
MPRKINTAEQIINKLRQAEIMLHQGSTVAEVCRTIEVTDQTYFRWRKEYGGMRVDQAKRLKSLEEENSRLKKLVADLSLDKAILQEAARGNC